MYSYFLCFVIFFYSFCSFFFLFDCFVLLIPFISKYKSTKKNEMIIGMGVLFLNSNNDNHHFCHCLYINMSACLWCKSKKKKSIFFTGFSFFIIWIWLCSKFYFFVYKLIKCFQVDRVPLWVHIRIKKKMWKWKKMWFFFWLQKKNPCEHSWWYLCQTGQQMHRFRKQNLYLDKYSRFVWYFCCCKKLFHFFFVLKYFSHQPFNQPTNRPTPEIISSLVWLFHRNPKYRHVDFIMMMMKSQHIFHFKIFIIFLFIMHVSYLFFFHPMFNTHLLNLWLLAALVVVVIFYGPIINYLWPKQSMYVFNLLSHLCQLCVCVCVYVSFTWLSYRVVFCFTSLCFFFVCLFVISHW